MVARATEPTTSTSSTAGSSPRRVRGTMTPAEKAPKAMTEAAVGTTGHTPNP